MSRSSRPLAGCLLMLMVTTLVAFPVNHVSPGNKLNKPLTKTMTRPVDTPRKSGATPILGGATPTQGAKLDRAPKPSESDLKFLREALNNIKTAHGSILQTSGSDSMTGKSVARLKRYKISDVKISKRCVNCSGKYDVVDDVTTERPVFMFDPLAVSKEEKEEEDFENAEPVPPTNNSLIILPLMAIIVFIGTVVAKCCRWTQKDVREVGFIVEAKPVKKKTIAKGIMQMHNFGMPIRTAKIKSKKGKTANMRSPEQFMFLPLLLGQTIHVTNKAMYSRAKSPPQNMTKVGSAHQFHPLTEPHDPGFDASDDTDDEKLVKTAGRKRQSSQARDSVKGKSPTPPSRGSGSSKRSRSTSKDKNSIDCPDIELDSSEEERLELEEQCRRGLQVLAQLDPKPLSRSSLGASMSSSSSSKITFGNKFSVKADVHEPAVSTNDLKLPQEPHGSRHSSADACVDTHDLIEHMEDYYGVDIRAFINLWHHRRRYAAASDSFDLDAASYSARTHEFKRSQSAKRPKKSKPSMKRQVSFPFDLPQSQDPDSPSKTPGVTPPSLSRAVSNDDDVFVMPQDIMRATPIHGDNNYEKRFEESVELRDLSVSKYPGFSPLPLSPTSSRHSICEDSGYHNHSFSKLVASPQSPVGPRIRRTSSDDSALATNLASESSQSNHEDSPQNKLNSPLNSAVASSLSLSDLTPKDNCRLNCSDGQETCASDSMQRTAPSCVVDVDSLGAGCNALDYAHENGVFENSGHRPKLKQLSNHVNMLTCDSETSGDTDKLLDRSDSVGSGFEDKDKLRKNSGLFNSARDIPVNLLKRASGSYDGHAHAGGDVEDDVISAPDDLYDSSPNAPLLQNSIMVSRGREKSTDRENNNEHMV